MKTKVLIMLPITTASLAARCFPLKLKHTQNRLFGGLSETEVHLRKVALKYQALYRSG